MANVWNEAMSRNSNITEVQPCTVWPAIQFANKNDDAHQRDNADRPHRKGGNAVDCESDHLGKRILGDAVQARKPVVGNGRSREAELNGEPTQEYMRLAI